MARRRQFFSGVCGGQVTAADVRKAGGPEMSEAQSSTMRAMSAPTIAKRGKASSHDVAGCSLRLSCGVRIRASDLMGWGATLVGFSRRYLGEYDVRMDWGDENY